MFIGDQSDAEKRSAHHNWTKRRQASACRFTHARPGETHSGEAGGVDGKSRTGIQGREAETGL
jgi:hypothetical protein